MVLPFTLKKYKDDKMDKETFHERVPKYLKDLFSTPDMLRRSYDAIVALVAVALGTITEFKMQNIEFE